VVLDLEDAVPVELKKDARRLAREGIGILKSLGIPAFVRINAFSQGGVEDVPEITTVGFSGVMLPKARTAAEVSDLDALLAYSEGRAGLQYGSVCILPLPETAEGLWNARDLAAASKRVAGLVGDSGLPWRVRNNST
jgi:citrate lyase subunit beta/citryl-CoA lyase